MIVDSVTLVYFSPTGTTRSVLTSMGEGTGLPVTHVDMTQPPAREQLYHIAENTLLIVGMPVYGGRVPLLCETVFSLLSPGSVPVVPVVVYGNRAYEDALLELADTCREKGYRLAGAGAFIGEHSFSMELGHGRPDAEDRAIAADFGGQALASVRAGRFFDISLLPGQRPYKERGGKLPVAPQTNANCTRCMLCAEKCPTQAISFSDPADVSVADCIYCAACVKICPVQAKYIGFAPLLQKMEAITAANRERKRPEAFLPGV